MIVKTEKNIANLSSTVGDNNKGYVRTFSSFWELIKDKNDKIANNTWEHEKCKIKIKIVYEVLGKAVLCA